jgi:molybdopterin biosynthesis enzyme
MKAIPVEQSVGAVLSHDITGIVPGECKGPAFRRGHVVASKDIQTLLDIGKANLYVYDLKDGYVHEDEAAIRLAAAAAGRNIEFSGPTEGKVTLAAAIDGLLCIDVPGLIALNSIQDITFGTIHTHQFVRKGRTLGATRVIPLAITEELLVKAERICRKSAPMVQVKPLKAASIGVVTTSSEIYSVRIKDGFGPVLRYKFEMLGSTVIEQIHVPDEVEMTVQAISSLVDRGIDLIAVTGGMSVDPDDQTPLAIRRTGGEIVSYGAPTFPGAVFLLAYLGEIPVVGLPGCVMYHKAHIFDLIVPRLLAGERLTREDIVAFGHGGFCESFDSCHFPVCDLGKV